jgi:N,N'-diacetyllegionaminate synthase
MKRNTIIIAEAGVNHNGDMVIAKKLIEVAAEAGADYVKFQTFIAKELVSEAAKKATYQVENTGNNDSQYVMLKKLELSHDQHRLLIDHCHTKRIKFLSTAFDLKSLEYLESLNPDLIKIPSGEITNLPYLEKVASLKRKTILSTGMCTMEDIEAAVKLLTEAGLKKEQITILHCNTEYPTPMMDVNLLAMNAIRKRFNVSVGYSDHTLGIEVPVAAVALGAEVIEKHFTLDPFMEGPDHKASLSPDDLIKMVKAIRNIENALGSSEKKISQSEQKNIIVARKSVHLARNLSAGHIIKESDLVMKRPGNGISPMKIKQIIGKSLKRPLKSDTMLQWEDLS